MKIYRLLKRNSFHLIALIEIFIIAGLFYMIGMVAAMPIFVQALNETIQQYESNKSEVQK